MTFEQQRHMDSLREQHDTPMISADNLERRECEQTERERELEGAQ